MSLRIAFIGYDEKQTRTYFREFAELNREQIKLCDLRQGRIVLLDGSEIYRATADSRFFYMHLDQIIIADDRRRMCSFNRYVDMAALAHNLVRSRVPPEFQWQYYGLDAEAGS